MSSSPASSTPASRQRGGRRHTGGLDPLAHAEAALAALAEVGGTGVDSFSMPSGAFDTPVSTGFSGAVSVDGLAGECAFFYLDDVMVLSGVCVPGGLPPLSRDGWLIRRGLPRLRDELACSCAKDMGGVGSGGHFGELRVRVVWKYAVGVLGLGWWKGVPDVWSSVRVAELGQGGVLCHGGRKGRRPSPAPWAGTVVEEEEKRNTEEGEETPGGTLGVRVEEVMSHQGVNFGVRFD